MKLSAWLLGAALLFISLVSIVRPSSAVDQWIGNVPIGQVGREQQPWGTDRPGGAQLFICRASYAAPGRHKGMHPGKIRTDFHGCHISYGGVEVELPQFEVVKRDGVILRWLPASNGQIPAGANYLPGGFEGTEDGGQQLFVCRTTERSGFGVQLGKIRRPFSGCHIPYGGIERVVGEYELATF